MSLATDILKRSGLAPLSAPVGSRTGRPLTSVSLKHRNAQQSLIGYLITGNRWDMMISRLNHRDDNTSGDTNKPLLR